MQPVKSIIVRLGISREETMKYSNLFIFIAVIVLLLNGCAHRSAIEKVSESESHFKDAVFEGRDFYISEEVIEGEQYRVFHQASTGFSGTGGIRRNAINRATSFCKQKEKQMMTVSEHTAAPPYILGNFPRIEIVFICVDPKKNKGLIAKTTDKYEKLTKIKDLLDNGVLTEEEFESEKKKILSEN
jgi:hypothetical protein